MEATYQWHSPDLETSVFGYPDGRVTLVVQRRGMRSVIDFTRLDGAAFVGRALERAALGRPPEVVLDSSAN